VTATSLTGGFGVEALATALALLDRGFVHVAASDAHAATWRAGIPCASPPA
jgi:tyrosine-protein phosphatase YwqE